MNPLNQLPDDDLLALLMADDVGSEHSIKASTHRGPTPLSFAQQRLWFLQQLSPDSSAYNLPNALHLRGPLDTSALAAALQQIIDRHDVLKTAFQTVDDEPRQVLDPQARIHVREEDLSGLTPHVRSTAVTERLAAEAGAPFDLGQAPLIRATLITLERDEHILLLNMHHIVSDAWSNPILMHDLIQAYQRACQGDTTPLARPAIQYADYARWQREEYPNTPAQQRAADYWAGYLGREIPTLDLPTEFPRNAEQQHRAGNLQLSVPTALSQQLHGFCQQQDLTPFIVLLGTWQLLLSRYSGQQDFTVGVPNASRNQSETQDLVGFFVSSQIYRTQITDDLTTGEFLQALRQQSRAAMEHADYPIELIIERLQLQRSTQANPLFQTLFNWRVSQDQPAALTLGELSLAFLPVAQHEAKFDLSMDVDYTPQQITASIEYSTALFGAATIERLGQHWLRLLQSLVDGPQRRLAELPMLDHAEQHQMVSAWNATATHYPLDHSVQQLIEAQVAATPNATALVFGDQQLSYHQLNQRANQLAHKLMELGVGPDALVGIATERSLEMVIGLLAVLKAGAAYVPLDPEYPQDRLSYMIEDSGIGLLLTQQHLLTQLPIPAALPVLTLDQLDVSAYADTNPEVAVDGENLAYVIYTSGSTGKPKGAGNRHSALTNRLCWMQQAYGLTADDTVLQKTPFSFDVSVWEFFWPLMVGARLVVARPEGHRDSAYLAELIPKQGVTTVHFVPSMLHAFLEELGPGKCESLKRVLCSGEALSFELAERFFARSEAELHNLYGPTEASIDVTSWPCERDAAGKIIPIGRPIANTQMYVLDAWQGPAPIRVPGELYIGGIALGRGYWHRADLTAERFIPDPFSTRPGARLYRTGDLARWLTDGSLEYLGRVDHQIKLRGFRIELGEIEAALGQHPEVREAVVLAREDEPGDKRLVAYVVHAEPLGPSMNELRRYLKEKLPEYMVPAAIVALPALPLTPSGKVDRKALPAPARPEQEEAFFASRTPIEEVLCGIFADVLVLGKVSVHENFFEIGGHSLLAMQVLARVRRSLGVELPLRAVFEAPSVAALAERVEAERRRGAALSAPALWRVPRDGELPLSLAQQRLWFLDQLVPDSPLYNLAAAVRLQGPLDVAALERSLGEIVRRHEALRTTFLTVDGRPRQVISAEPLLPMPVIDLRVVAEVAREENLQRLLSDEAQKLFDLARGPLFRVLLVTLGEQEHVLLLTVHHIVSDAWSVGVLIEELRALYAAFHAGEPSPLPELPFQYVDYAVWQRQWLKGEVLDIQLAYWKRKLEGAPPSLDLPTDRPRPAVQRYRGSTLFFRLSSALTEALGALSRRAGVTRFMVLLAGFQLLLARYAGVEDVSVGSPIAGRTVVETEALIGFFINALTLRTDLSGDPSFLGLLERVREVTLDAYAHQDVPFEQVVDALQPERSLNRAPLFQVMFVLQNTPMPALALSELTLSLVPLESKTAKFDLSVSLAEDDGGMQGVAEYDADLFDEATIGRMIEQFQAVLEGAMARPERRLSELSGLPEAQRRQLLEGWNQTAAEFPRDRCLHQLFEQHAERAPEAEALTFEGERLSYGALNARANRLGRHLRDLGVVPESPVGVFARRSIELIVGVLAILKAGGIYMPLDPSLPSGRLSFMLEDAGIEVVLAQGHLMNRLPACDAFVVPLDAEATVGRGEREDNLAGGARPEGGAYVIYTSGSTGKPKGVLIEHRGACNLAAAQQRAFTIEPGDRVLQFSRSSFDASIWEIIMALTTGATLCLASDEALMPGPELARLLKEQQINITLLPPTALGALPDAPLPALRTLLVGGEACPPELVERWAARTQFLNAYGPTEITVCATIFECRGGGTPPIGRPLANTRVYVLDARLEPVPVGVPGELYIGGAGLARGYVGRAGLTADRFVPDPFSGEPGARLYRTGDLARWQPTGVLEFAGRIDHQVKLRGFRIEVGEVEAALRAHPAVREAVVMVREDAPGDRRLVAYLLTAQASPPATGEMRSHLQQRLPDYMLPAAFVWLEALPLTSSGKVDRKALPAPDGARPALDGEFVAPRSPVEELLASAWAEVLGVAQVGVHDNFFNLGGDSILAIQVISRAQQRGIAFAVRQMFQHQTVAALATVATVAAAPGASQEEVRGPVTLTPIVRRFVEQDGVDPHHYNQAVLLDLHEALPLSLIEEALQHLVRHHDALRFRLSRDEAGVWLSHAGVDGNVPVKPVDLRAAAPEREAQAIEEAAAEVQASLNLSEGPLVAAALMDLGPSRPSKLLLVIHHLAVDGVSWRILLEDLQTALKQLQRGEVIRLPLKTTSFQQWAERLSAYAQSDTVAQEQSFWLSGVASSRLPVDLPEGANTVASARSVEVALTAEETRALLQQVPEVYRTQINDVLLAALAQSFARWTGVPRLLLDLEGHGREDIGHELDLSRTVGWFTSLYPAEIEAPSAPVGEVLKAVKEQLRRTPNRGFGYGLLRYLREDPALVARLESLPRAEVVFNYLGQFDQSLQRSALFDLSSHSPGPTLSPRAQRTHVLEITGLVTGGQLRFSWAYSENLHHRSSIEELSRGFLDALRALIAHCLEPDAGGRTPADFPLAGLTQAALDRLVGTGRDVEDIYPLSPMQQGMLFHKLRDPASSMYVEQLSLRLSGALNVEAFASEWKAALARHPILRTAFAWEGLDAPLQIVRTSVPLPWTHHDWRHLLPREQEERLEALLAEERAPGFDLAVAPLMRIALLQLTDHVYQCVWTHHHLLLDGWSLALFFKELFHSYEATWRGDAIQPEVRRPYRDYIAWLQQQDMSAAQAFWREALRGFSAPTPLSVVRASGKRDEALAASSAELGRRLSAATTTALLETARAHGLTLNTLVQGAWALLLSRYSGEEDVVFGATVSGRSADLAGIDAMVGIFINTLPVRVLLPEDMPVLSWLKQLQHRQAEPLRYEFSPLTLVQRCSEIARNEDLFSSLLVVENYPVDPTLRQGNSPLVITDVRAVEQTNYPLTIVVVPDRELFVRALYATDLLDEATVSRLLGHFETLLEGITTSPEERIGDLSLLTTPERQQLLTEWNNTGVNDPVERSVHALFEGHAARAPEAVAVVFDGQRLTYRELNERANRLAHHLRALGVGPEVLVGLCVERSVEMVVGLLGILKAGGAYVPLDPAYPSQRLAFMVSDAGMPVLVTQQALLSQLPEHGARVVCLDTDGEAIGRESSANPASGVEPHHLAYVIYTSGSTGAPKGVLVEHGHVMRLLHATEAWFQFDARDVWTLFHSYAFDFSVWELWGALAYGGRLVVVPFDVSRSPEAFHHLLVQEGVTVLNQTPSAFRQLVAADVSSPEGTKLSLRYVIFGGEALDLPSLRPWFERHGDQHPVLVNMYGITETTVHVTYRPLCLADLDGGAVSPIGCPIPDLQVHLLDRHGQLVPIGVAGELCVGGAGVARGYLNRPELTVERFVPDTFGGAPGARLYKAGDLARRLPDGTLEYLGRIDQQVKIRGFRIELGEVEAALGRHPEVREAVVLAREDVPGDKRLVAYLVARDTLVPSSAELRGFLQQSLPDYMIPAAFVPMEAMPLPANGKLDRRALPARDGTSIDRTGSFIGPRDKFEFAIAQIWEELLKVEPVGVRDDFFALGGHSLLAVQLMACIRERVGQALPLSVLFQNATVEALAQQLREDASPRAWSPLVQIQPGGPRRPVFLVHPGGGTVFCYAALARHLGREWPIYGLQARGTEGDPTPLDRIEEMAAFYIEALRSVQPEGPYALGGWSFGGLVAFEMAQQLKEAGHEVALLALLDMSVPRALPYESWDDVAILVDMAGVPNTEVSHDMLRSLSRDELLRYFLDLAHERNLVPPGFDLPQLERWVRVYRSHHEATWRYKPRPYPGPITVFRARVASLLAASQGVHVEREPDLGWGGLSPRPIEVHEVPGDHESLVSEPHVVTLAERLRQCLLEAEQPAMANRSP